MAQTTITGSFKKKDGSAAANCVLRLSMCDFGVARFVSPDLNSPVINITLDAGGNIPGGTTVDGYGLIGTMYRAQLLDPVNAWQIWGGEVWMISGVSWAAPTAINALI